MNIRSCRLLVVRSLGRTFSLLSYGLVFLVSLIALQGCGEQEPIKLGFIGGTSGRVADLGVAGRNGVILAVDQVNANGGINGRPVMLMLKNDMQETGRAQQAAEELVADKVDAIIGPMTSSMTLEALPVAEREGVVMMGVTVTTNLLARKDDYFFRTLSPTKDHAAEMAYFLNNKKGTNKAAIIYDSNNLAYTESWKNDFSEALNALGGEVVDSQSFGSSNQVKFDEIAANSLAAKPDTVILVTNSVDAALLAKQIRTMDADIQMATSEWAGTERLIEMGGRYVERTVVPQYFDRNNEDPDYLVFYNAYVERFSQSPGFPGLVAYNAANVVLTSLANKNDNESLKQSILRIGSYPGIQGAIVFDPYGDVKSRTYLTEVIDGQFILSE